jgi:hypothetical protein
MVEGIEKNKTETKKKEIVTGIVNCQMMEPSSEVKANSLPESKRKMRRSKQRKPRTPEKARET